MEVAAVLCSCSSFIYYGEGLWSNGKCDGFCFACFQENRSESSKLRVWNGQRRICILYVNLNHIPGINCALVGDSGLDCNWCCCGISAAFETCLAGNICVIYVGCAVFTDNCICHYYLPISQSISKWELRLILHIAVSTSLHGIICKIRKLFQAIVEGHWQFAGWGDISEQYSCGGFSTFSTWVPQNHHCIKMFFCIRKINVTSCH